MYLIRARLPQPQEPSGVVYGVNGEVNYDPQSRVNTFAHVNHTEEQTRLGVLLCINWNRNSQFMGEKEYSSRRYFV